MRNFVQSGNVITLAAPTGGIAAGDGHQAGQFFGVATTSAAAGEQFELQLSGVFDLPKASGEVWTPGELLYWDSASEEVTAVSGVRMLIGACSGNAAAEDTTGPVRLNGTAAAQSAEQSLFLFADDDPGLAGVVAGLGAEDEGRLILVTDRSGQGPQVLHVDGGAARPLIGLSATVTISAVEPSGTSFVVPTATDLNLAEEIGASVRNEFPTGAWVFTDFELIAPASGYVRTALSISLNVSSPCIVACVVQEWDGATWLDVGTAMAQELAPQTIPYQLTGFDELLATEGTKYRIVVRHDAAGSRSLTVYKAISITNFVFAA